MNAPFNYLVNPQVVTQGQYIAPVWQAMLPAAIYDRRLLGMALSCTNTAGIVSCKALVYLGFVAPANLIDQTSRGGSNTADYSGGPYIVQRANTIIVQWLTLGSAFTGTETVSATFRVDQLL